jgi:hypothetical protein
LGAAAEQAEPLLQQKRKLRRAETDVAAARLPHVSEVVAECLPAVSPDAGESGGESAAALQSHSAVSQTERNEPDCAASSDASLPALRASEGEAEDNRPPAVSQKEEEEEEDTVLSGEGIEGGGGGGTTTESLCEEEEGVEEKAGDLQRPPAVSHKEVGSTLGGVGRTGDGGVEDPAKSPVVTKSLSEAQSAAEDQDLTDLNLDLDSKRSPAVSQEDAESGKTSKEVERVGPRSSLEAEAEAQAEAEAKTQHLQSSPAVSQDNREEGEKTETDQADQVEELSFRVCIKV